MCRCQVEDGDIEVVHEVLARHHLFLTSRPLWRPWGLQLLPLHRPVQLEVMEGKKPPTVYSTSSSDIYRGRGSSGSLSLVPTSGEDFGGYGDHGGIGLESRGILR